MRRYEELENVQRGCLALSGAGIGPVAAWADMSREGPCEWIGTSSDGLSKSSTLEV